MASAQSYISTSLQNMSNNPNMTIQQIIQMLGGYSNPATSDYTPAEQRDVTDPTLMTIAQYLQTLGGEGYTYEYSDFLNKLNEATRAGYDTQFNALNDAQTNYFRDMGAAQATAADTIRNQYSQAIQQGISKGMQNANMLSTLLGTSQAAAAEATQLAQDRYQTGQEYRAQILKDAADALSQSNNAYNTLFGNIRQLYNDDIQQKTADLEYNASVIDSNAQFAANKYTADTNYASGINTNASSIFNNNQSVLSSIMAAASQAAAQDNYSDAYKAAALAAAEAQKQAAQISADAQRYAANKSYAASVYNNGSNGTGSTSGNIVSKPTSTTKTPSDITNAASNATKQSALVLEEAFKKAAQSGNTTKTNTTTTKGGDFNLATGGGYQKSYTVGKAVANNSSAITDIVKNIMNNATLGGKLFNKSTNGTSGGGSRTF